MNHKNSKGWCPTVYNPMRTGDGFLIRLQPRFSRLSRDQALGVCKLSNEYGSGTIEITRRANLQLRGTKISQHKRLLDELLELNLLEASEEIESRPNLIIAPDWEIGGVEAEIYKAFYKRQKEFPVLPPKFGFSVDTKIPNRLKNVPSDIRLETDGKGALLVAADGSECGIPVTKDDAICRMIELAEWFSNSGGNARKRMRYHLQQNSLPTHFLIQPRLAFNEPLVPGPSEIGYIVGLPFGKCSSKKLQKLILQSRACNIRITPWKSFILENCKNIQTTDFVIKSDDPTLKIHSCPGKPSCNSASVFTRSLARKLAGKTNYVIHISGCEKGCAFSGKADKTLVGESGSFSLVENGHPWDEPIIKGINPQKVLETLDNYDAL